MPKHVNGNYGWYWNYIFYPSKNLGAYGDGGAIFTNNDELADKIFLAANHGQNKRYHHKIIGCNSRLDSIQAEILNVKLKYLSEYNRNRSIMANNYNLAFNKLTEVQTPKVINNSTHVYHQYTLKIANNKRDQLKEYLSNNGIPSMIYYPIPLYKQQAFKKYVSDDFQLVITEELSKNVISLPIHTELESSNQDYIIEKFLNFLIENK